MGYHITEMSPWFWLMKIVHQWLERSNVCNSVLQFAAQGPCLFQFDLPGSWQIPDMTLTVFMKTLKHLYLATPSWLAGDSTFAGLTS